MAIGFGSSKEKLAALEKENARLKRAIEELSVLNELSTAINSTMTINGVVDLVVQKCVQHLKVEQAAVMLLDAASESEAQQFKTMIRHAELSTSRILPYRLDTELTGWMLKYQTPLLVNDLSTDERFGKYADGKLPIRSLLSVPLMMKGEMIGMLTAFNKNSPEGFTTDEQRLLSIIATQSAQVIENARLLEEEKALLRMREEMRMAHDIQMNLLPGEAPEIPGYDIAGFSIPAREVGGDYYDFIPLDNQKLAFCLGDVTGKGIPAAMLMANTHAAIRGQTLSPKNASECINNANALMFQSTGTGKFVTLFFGILDAENHTLSFCNAGHDEPLLVSGDEITRLKTGGVVLGFVPQYPFAEESIDFPKGSRLIIYSDGITEAMNQDNAEFGETRLQKIIMGNAQLSPRALIQKIIESVQTHSDGVPQSDDMTMVVIQRK